MNAYSDVGVASIVVLLAANNDLGLAEISALLAALGILIYALGLVALCWPIYRRITMDASTALYAVSLMPKTVVAGQGVRMLFGLPLVATTVWVTMSVVQHIALNIWNDFSESYSSWVEIGGVILISAVIIGGFLYLITRMSAIWEAIESQGTTRLATLFVFAFALVMGVVTSLVVGGTFFESGAILPQLPGWASTLKTLMWIFILNSILGFTLAFAGEPPLPGIALNDSPTPEGKLVAHADGIWYVLDDSGKLMGIPDDKAGRVLVFPN